MKVAAISILCALVAGCVLAPLPGDLRSAREACNRQYPRRVGNYLPHAQCVNAAVERYALPTASHPDLLRLQEGLRATLSAKVDRRQISVSAAERRMAEADRMVAVAERERAAGLRANADEQAVDRVVQLLLGGIVRSYGVVMNVGPNAAVVERNRRS